MSTGETRAAVLRKPAAQARPSNLLSPLLHPSPYWVPAGEGKGSALESRGADTCQSRLSRVPQCLQALGDHDVDPCQWGRTHPRRPFEFGHFPYEKVFNGKNPEVRCRRRAKRRRGRRSRLGCLMTSGSICRRRVHLIGECPSRTGPMLMCRSRLASDGCERSCLLRTCPFFLRARARW